MFSRFLTDNVPMSTRWAKNSSAKMRAGRSRRNQIAAAITHSFSKVNPVTLCIEPLDTDGNALDFRTSKRNQYVLNILGRTFRVSKANGHPVYRLTGVGFNATLYVPA